MHRLNGINDQHARAAVSKDICGFVRLEVPVDRCRVQAGPLRSPVHLEVAERLTIELAGPLSDEQRSKLLEIARKCPVHRTLTSEKVIEIGPGGESG